MMETDVETVSGFDLRDYARRHRLRLRNLHDGGPVPPARLMPRIPARRQAFTADGDRWDAIVGYDGYVAMDGDQLGVYLCYKTARGVNAAIRRIQALGGQVDQVGDFEVGATLPVDQIKVALELIRVSRLSPGKPGGSPENLIRAEACVATGRRIDAAPCPGVLVRV